MTPKRIDPAAYAPLLDTIAKGESGGNYNAYFGNPGNTEIRFTSMSVNDVLNWQSDHIAKGNVSNAVGKYQIIQPTLEELVNKLHIDRDQKFDPTLQDELAIALLERRGSIEYVHKKISSEQFAANIAMEWAALPKATGTNPHESYYGSDGINKSTITVAEIYNALGSFLHTASDRSSRPGAM